MNNRRRHQRLEIDLPASLAIQGQSFDDCRICNFSRGGIYLNCDDDRLNGLLPAGYIAESDRQEAVLTVASNQVRIAIVYLNNQGLGGSIIENGEGEALYRFLQSQREPQKSEQTDLDTMAVSPLIEELRQRLLDYLNPQLTSFFTQA
ncbi:MAG: PilZ domain-containing protein, partial [Candidatus Thiodiazotropha sp.]